VMKVAHPATAASIAANCVLDTGIPNIHISSNQRTRGPQLSSPAKLRGAGIRSAQAQVLAPAPIPVVPTQVP
jgi:hypothetical protein